MEIRKIAKIGYGQDGAIWGDELFRFDSRGHGSVYRMEEVLAAEGGEVAPFATFTLDGAERLVPHSNAVFFGGKRYEEGDEFPILYTNVYNNYAQSEDPLIGVCCAYRLVREGDGFSTTLIQMIEIGFTEDASLWKATEESHGVRPYGNFLMDREGKSYYAFVMRNEEKGTRYFRFAAPDPHAGESDPVFGVRRVVLDASQIEQTLDLPYHRFLQGGTLYEGRIYSTEGFTDDPVNRPAIRVLDLQTGKSVYYDITAFGCREEPELIDFYKGVCYYSDIHGNTYTVTFA